METFIIPLMGPEARRRRSRNYRAFILRHTRLAPVPGLPGMRLHLADDVLPVWHAAQVETQDSDAAVPYWAIAWAGGLAIGRYLREHPEVAAGRRVFDLGSGSGLCAIAALQAGAARATSADVDPFAAAAIELNARANGCRVTIVRRDVLDEEPPDADLILAGDCWYEARLAGRVLPWLRGARDRGIDVLIGDPGRRYLPTDELVELASYDARTTGELDDLDHNRGRVYSLRPVTALGARRTLAAVSFTVSADAYDRFMGRYSAPLAPQLTDFAGVVRGQQVLDVGCGPGALTAELVARMGADAVAAVDPSEPFVAAARERHPGVDVRRAAAEQLPFGDDRFDAALAQLVVHFMADPVAGLREMSRVTRRDGVVAASVWDHAGGQGPLSLFWESAHELDPNVDDESRLAGTRQGHLAELFEAAGLHDIEDTALTVRVRLPTFDDWWEPFTLGVGPAGSYTARLDRNGQARLRELCREKLSSEPFDVTARAWAARGLA